MGVSGGLRRLKLGFRYQPPPGKLVKTMVPYGVKQSAAYKESKLQQRLAIEAARKQRETKAMILDTRDTLFMCLKHNTGINWFRAKEILKHLEMHIRQPSSSVNSKLREKITLAANLVKRGI